MKLDDSSQVQSLSSVNAAMLSGLTRGELRRMDTVTTDDTIEAIFANIDDPEMYRELGIQKPRDKKLLSKYDHEKISEYLIRRDELLLKNSTGGVQIRNDNYIAAQRKHNKLYQEIEQVVHHPANGNFTKVNIATTEMSWRATTTPMGFARMARNLPHYVGELNIRSALNLQLSLLRKLLQLLLLLLHLPILLILLFFIIIIVNYHFLSSFSF